MVDPAPGRNDTLVGDELNELSTSGGSQADTMDDAERLLTSHPHLQMPGAAIEVYESLQIPGM
jgi:hypothetical protein